MKIKFIVSVLLCLGFFHSGVAFAGVIPKASWTLKYTDSEELVGENGAAENSFDENPGTIWHSQWQGANPTTPHEVQIDLGTYYDINGFRYLPRQDGATNGHIGQYEFFVSDDGVNWGEPVATGTFSNSAAEKEVLFPTTMGRYIRFRALTEVNGHPWTSVAEITALGDLYQGNLPPNGLIDSLTKDVTIQAGDQLRFTATGTDPEGDLPLSYLWHFGAGSGVPDSNLEDPGPVRFDIPGSYTVSLNVTDSLGGTDTTPATRVVTVTSDTFTLTPYWASVETSPFSLITPPSIENPVLTGQDVTDVQGAFVADPFLFQENGTWYLFFEILNAQNNQGDLGVATSSDGLNWNYEQLVLDEPWHLSYPYVFKYNGEYYMIPESSEINEIRLYKSSNFPYEWNHFTTLATGRDFVDPSVFWFNGTWWMFASNTTNSDLYLFFSDNLTGGWTEHPMSPVIQGDKTKARPTGRAFVYNQDRIIRTGQQLNGEGVRAFEVDVLTRTAYAEHELDESPILSKSGIGWNADGMHHFDPWWDGSQWLCAVDGNVGGVWAIGIYQTPDPSSPDGVIDTPAESITIAPGEGVVFTGTGSDPDENLPLSYRWNFGAGSGVQDSIEENPGLVTFQSPGIYTVTFTVTDALGNADPIPASVVVRVASNAPVISKAGWTLKYVDSQEVAGENGAAGNAFDGNPQTLWHTEWLGSNPRPPHEIQIDLGLTYDIEGFRYLPRQDGGSNGRVAQYELYLSSDGVNWGSPVASGAFADSSLEKEVPFALASGRFVRFRALSEVHNNPWTSMAELSLLGRPFAGNQAPDGTITNPSGNITVAPGEGVAFSGTGSDPDGNLPLSYHWDFGTGSGLADSTSKDPGVLAFAIPGTYTVTLTVTDALGKPDPVPHSVVVKVKSDAPLLSKAGWTLKSVDSQELVGENGDARNAFDDDPQTIWHTEWVGGSPPPPHEIQIDLGLIYDIEGFLYLPRQDGGVNGRIAQYEFYVSRDGVDWGSPVAADTFANSGLEKEVLFAPASGRFVRLRALTEVNGNPWTSMAEISLYGRPFSGNQEPNGIIESPTGNVVIPATWSVQFLGGGIDPDDNLPLQYAWNFGVGSGIPDSNLEDPGLVQYDIPGTYNVTMSVADSLGAIDPSPASVLVTVSETEGQADLATNFSLNPLGSGIPLGWTERWRQGETSYTVQPAESMIGHELFYQTSAFTGDGDGGRRLLSFDAADALGADTELLVLFKPFFGGTYHADTRLYLRASGTPGNETAYFLTHSDNFGLGRIELYKYVDGVMTFGLAPKQDMFFAKEDQRYWARFRANGTQISAKIWPYGGLEPSEWDLVANDSSIASAGWSGVGVFSKNDNARFYHAAVADNGDTAIPLDYGVKAEKLNLPNLDAESGTTSSWLSEFGTILVDANFQRNGAYCFAGGASDWRAYQRVDLSAEGVAELLADKQVYFSFSAWQRAYGGNDDPGRIGIRFLDGANNEISSVFTPFDNVSASYSRKHLVEAIPANAKYVDLLLEGQYVTGNVAGAYFDDIEVGYSYEK